MNSDCVSLRVANGQSPSLVQATPEQVLTGLIVGFSDLTALCSSCHQEVGEGSDVTVYSYRRPDVEEWSVARCYCRACAPAQITSPTLGTTEALASATLGVRSFLAEQTHWLCLNDVETVAISPPKEGTEP